MEIVSFHGAALGWGGGGGGGERLEDWTGYGCSGRVEGSGVEWSGVTWEGYGTLPRDLHVFFAVVAPLSSACYIGVQGVFIRMERQKVKFGRLAQLVRAWC